MAKMGMMKLAIGAAAGAAAVAGQTTRDPPAFMNRVTDGLLASYTFQQSDCANGEIPADFGTVGPLTMTSADSSVDMCPSAQVGDALLTRAHNGVSLNGLKGADTLQTVESVAGATAELPLGNEFSLEFWIKPDFSQDIADINEYTLFELGNAAPSDNSANWRCGIDYDLKVNMLGSNGRIVLEANLGNECFDFTLSQTEDVIAGQVYHLVLTGTVTEITDANGVYEESLFTSFLYVNGAETDDDDDDDTFEFSFSSWNSDAILRLGSSPAIASTNGLLTAATTWSGDILMFSMYDRALSEAEAAQNYNAWLSNSSPGVAGTSASVSGAKEDESSEIDLSSIALYDFDTDAVFTGAEPTNFNPTTLSSSYKFVEGTQTILGTFSASEGGDALNAGDVFEQLFFLPSTANAYGAETCVVNVEVTDTFQSSAESVVLNMYVEPTNDGLTCDSVELVGDAGVPQSKTGIVELTASDLDCVSDADLVEGPDGTSSCETLGVENFVLEQPVYGAFFKNTDCTEIITAEEYPFSFAATAPDAAGGKYSASVCWQSCFGTSGDVPCPAGASVGDDGVLATEQIAVTALSNEFTSSANVTIQVNSALSVTTAHTEMFEETRTAITFSGSDAICDDVTPVPAICASRTRMFQVVALPPASMGTLIDASDDPVIVGQVVESGQVFFLAAKDYFNRDSFPLCGVDSFTTCPDGLVSSCTGPESMPSVCEASVADASRYTSFTTSFLGGKTMGGCDATPEVGCPVEVTVALVVDGERSPPKVGNAIWVTNLNDDVALETKVAPELINTNVVTPFEDASGEQLITISDSSDSNSRVLELTISATDNVLLTSNAAAALVSFPECNPTVTDSNCSSVVAQGTMDGLNAQIALMRYSTAVFTGEVEINVTVTDVAASLRSSTLVDVAGAPQEVSASVATFSFSMDVATLSPTVSPTSSPTGAPTAEPNTKSLLMIVVPSTLGGIILLLAGGLYLTSRKSSNTAAMQPASSSARKGSFQV